MIILPQFLAKRMETSLRQEIAKQLPEIASLKTKKANFIDEKSLTIFREIVSDTREAIIDGRENVCFSGNGGRNQAIEHYLKGVPYSSKYSGAHGIEICIKTKDLV